MTEPRWLSEREMRAWMAFVETSLLLQREMEVQLRDDGNLTQTQYWVLTRLLAAPDRRLRMTELADALVSSRSGLTYQVAQLEKAGYVRRERCPSDERGVLAVVTDEGEAVMRRTAPGHVQVVRENFVDVLGPERLDQLADVLAEARDHLRRRHDPRPRP